MDNLLARSGLWLTRAEVERFDKYFRLWGTTNQHLAVRLYGTKCFKVRPKSNYMWRIYEHVQRTSMNPLQ